MTITRALRILMGLATLLVVVWSFAVVIRQVIDRRGALRDRPVVLTIMHWGDQSEDAIVAQLVREYMASHPQVQINRINPGGSFPSKLKTMMAAGTPPDLFYLSPADMPSLAKKRLIRPVDDYIAQDRAAGRGAFYDDFYPILLDGFKYDVTTNRTGTGPQFGLPKDFTTAVFYVNLDLFEKAGVKVPYDGWTWAEFEVACRKISALRQRPEFAGRDIYGANFATWPETLRNILWTFGADFFGPGGFRDVALDSSHAQEALSFIRRLRLEDRLVFNSTGIGKEGGQEFFTGNIGMNGPLGRWLGPQYKSIKSFRWDVVPVPYKAPEFAASQIFFNAWTMSSATKYPDQCYDLMRYLCGPVGARRQAELGLSIPALRSVANSDSFLASPGLPKHHSELFLKATSVMRLEQNPPEPEWGRILGGKIPSSIQTGSQSTMDNAREIRRLWLAELASPLRRTAWGPFNWRMVLFVAAGVMVGLLAFAVYKARQERLGAIDRVAERTGLLFIAPWLVGFLCLTVGPMIASLLLSLSQWEGLTPVADARWVGAANYEQVITTDPTFVKSLKVTAYYVVLAVPTTQVAALLIALLMNMKLPGIGFFRTVYFIPSVVSGVALAVLWLQVFNNDYGILNRVLSIPLAWLNTKPPDWFGIDADRWAIPAFVIMGLWGVGGGMMIYLAGLKGIPVSLYEAATIDGAGILRQFWNVTLPQLSPLLFYNLVMGVIGSFQVFTQAYVMGGSGGGDATLFYVLNLYRQAFEFHNMGYASAMAWILFVICLLLTLIVFRGSKKLVYYEGLRS